MYAVHGISNIVSPCYCPRNVVESAMVSVYHRSTFKCEDAINVNAFPDLQLLNSQLKYYVRGDESRWAQNAIVQFAISLKT